MRIGELARQVGVSTDTVRFYEKSGWLPSATREDNSYRQYEEDDVEHLRLLIELKRLDLPLDVAAQIAGWCHSGHCRDTTAQLPALIAGRRASIAQRITGLRALDERLAALERHLERQPRALAVLDTGAAAGPCCDAAGAVVSAGCACCAVTPDAYGYVSPNPNG
jgi:DNA-binding transcriptional MerR regulator